MTVVVTGGTGLLGYSLKVNEFFQAPDIYFPPRKQMDITKKKSVFEYLQGVKPSVILHAAAMAKVDECEQNTGNAFNVNVVGTFNMATVAEMLEAHFIFISTDYVFDGCKGEPYLENDLCNPVNIYGKSKYVAECICERILTRLTIVRTSGLFGPKGNNFFQAIFKQVVSNNTIPVVTDQTVTVTHCPDLANVLAELVGEPRQGIFHFTNSGQASWNQMAKYAVEKAGFDNRMITEITASNLKRPAIRPSYSALGTIHTDNKIFLRPWQHAVEEYVNTLTNTDMYY